jgi:hypothetical protein
MLMVKNSNKRTIESIGCREMSGEILTVLSELVAEINRKLRWVRLIGVSGVAFAAVLLYIETAVLALEIFGPLLGYSNQGVVRLGVSVMLSVIILAPLLGLLAGGTGVRILLFLLDWNRRYNSFKRDRRELEDKFLPMR